MSHTDILFRDLHADDLPEVTEIESLCFNCYNNGSTRLLLTRIPFFRDVVISSFKCEECGFENNSIDAAGKIQSKGIKLVLTVKNKDDVNRRVVQGKYSVIRIPSLNSEFPVSEGVLTTVEGVLESVITNIQKLQDERRKVDVALANQLDDFVIQMQKLLSLENEFIVELADPTGNSIIESLTTLKSDPHLIISHFRRSAEEQERIGTVGEEDEEPIDEKTYAEEAQCEFEPFQDVVIFQVNCPKCNAPTETRMKMLDIPHFKEVIVMATTCDYCGLKENEVKGGCGISEKGHRYTLKIEDTVDLSRDLLKSEFAVIKILELDVETSTGGALGGRFTTVEGLINSVSDQLAASNPFCMGDSVDTSEVSSGQLMRQLIVRLREAASGVRIGNGEPPLTLVIQDSTGNSYIQDLYHPDIDPRLSLEHYDRSEEENEELGLNDMKTE